MSLQTYIGARYVPRFMGTYDPTQIYEALDIVDNGSGTSYISRKDVPPGTPLTNTDYWFIYGASSGAIINLENRMNAAEVDILGLERKAIYLGNSYAQGEGTESGNGLYARTKDLFTDSRLYFNGGVGFLTYTLHSTTFGDLLNQAISDASGIPADEVTDIIILSAWGDTCAWMAGSTQAQFQSAMNTLSTTAKGAYPNLKQIRLALVESRQVHDISTAEGTSYYADDFEINHLFMNTAPKAGIEYLGWIGWETFMRGSSYAQSDGYHPTAVGNDILAAYLRQALTGSYQYSVRTGIISGGSDITSGTTFTVKFVQSPDKLSLNVRMISLAAGNTPTQYTQIDLLRLYTGSNSDFIPAIPRNTSDSIDTWMVNTNADCSVLDPYLCILKDRNGKGYIEGTPFAVSHAVTARSNASVFMQTLEYSYHTAN